MPAASTLLQTLLEWSNAGVWIGYAFSTDEIQEKYYKVLAGKPEAKRPRSLYADKLILKLIVKNRM
jgi:hypothetical protein